MCEPMHSIVQFPDQDDDGNPTGSIITAIPAPTGTDAGFWEKLRKRIKDWFHFSFMGSGHSESLGRLTPAARDRIPMDTKYEAAWWNRAVKLDGPFNGPDYNAPLALEAAKEYASRVSTGNLTILRQFLTVSLQKSERAWSYVREFPMMLVSKGRDLFMQKLRRLLNTTDLHEMVKSNLDLVIKVMMGFTRKRDLLICEWADDTKLWGVG